MYLDQTSRPVRALNAVRNHASGAPPAGNGCGHRDLRSGGVGVSVDQPRAPAQLADHRGDARGAVVPGDVASAPPVVHGHLDEARRGVGGPVRGAGRSRSGVPVVVLGDEAPGHRDQAVLVRALTCREDRLTAQRPTTRPLLPPSEHDHVHAGIGVVGDRDRPPAARGRPPDQRRGGAAALAHLSRLGAYAAVVALPPGDRRTPATHVEAVERVRGDDEDAAGLVHGEAVGDRLAGAEVPAADGAGRGDVPDDAGDRDEPDPTAPVRQGALDARPAGHSAQVDVAHGTEAPALRSVLGDRQQVAGERGHDGAVPVVEVEVAAAGEVVEGERPRSTRRQLLGGQRRQRRGVQHPQGRALRGDADGDDAAAAVEGDRCALGREQGAGDLRVAPQWSRTVVGVGLVGVVVDVAATVGRHERVPGDPLRAVGPRARGMAGEVPDDRVAGVGGDGRRRSRALRGERGRQSEREQQGQDQTPGHAWTTSEWSGGDALLWMSEAAPAGVRASDAQGRTLTFT